MAVSADRRPLVTAALGLVGEGTTADGLGERFGAAGARLDHGVADELLATLVAQGLVRVARGDGEHRRYVLTTLGREHLAGVFAGDDARLEELERLRTDLLGTIAHELRTPLTAVRTSAGLLLDPTAEPTDEQRRALARTIERNADRMQRIVGDILDLTRFRSGSVVLQLRRFDPVELARSVIASIAPLAEGRRQSVELEAPATLPRVYADHRRLWQALLNLVSNAHRFSDDGGRIVVGVEAAGGEVAGGEAAGGEAAGGEAAGGARATIRWRVTDEGPGIAEADRARLFERFFVGRNDRTTSREGVGLGLPTALAIAQAHGGTIEVDSAPGEGSTFTLVVPVDGPPEAE